MSRVTEALQRAKAQPVPAFDDQDHPWGADLLLDVAADMRTASARDEADRTPVQPRGFAERFPGTAPSEPRHLRMPATETAVSRKRHGLSDEEREPLIGMIDRLFLPTLTEPLRCVAVAGVETQIASAPVAAALAEMLAERASARVCLVDANFTSPSLHEQFGTGNEFGLTDALASGRSLAGVAVPVAPNLWLMPRGTADVPLAVATTGPFSAALAEFIGTFDYVLFDMEPGLERPVAAAFARFAAGVVLLVDADATRRQTARRAIERLRSAELPVLGAILTNRRYPVPHSIYRLL